MRQISENKIEVGSIELSFEYNIKKYWSSKIFL